MHLVGKNIKNSGIILIFILNLFIFSSKGYAQEVEIILGKSTITLSETYTLALYFPREYKREYKAYHAYFFPDITDFEKGKTVFSDDEESRGYFITQHYKPRKTGTFDVYPFRIKLKDKIITSKKTHVKVVSGGKNDPSTDIKLDDELEYEEVSPDVFLDVRLSKPTVYVGEGVGIQVALMISAQNKAELTFFDIEEQRKEIIKQLKTGSCFIEESSSSGRFGMDTLVVKEKKYLQWKLYEAVYFPIDSVNITIPAVYYSLLSYSLAKSKNNFIDRKVIKRTYTSKRQVLKVRSIPSLKKSLPVGFYKVYEEINPTKFVTGKSFRYSFSIQGEGNIAALPSPTVVSSQYFDIYAPKISEDKQLLNGKIVGSKTFVYYVTPKEPGSFNLSDFFKWRYFNTAKASIDTLSSSLSIKVRGESLKNNYISVNNPGDFYNRISSDNNQPKIIAKDDELKFWANLFILVMLIGTAIIVIRK